MDKPTASCFLTQLGEYPISHALGVSNDCFPSTWVLNSGVIDQMTYSSHGLFSYNPCFGDKNIRVIDDTLATMAGQGKIAFTSSLTLKFVLHVPKLSANLLSIHQITRDLNCTITFFPSHCVTQDRTTGRMNGHAKELEGFYLLRSSFGNGDCMPLSHFSKKFSLDKAQIWLHHHNLGHPSFPLPKKRFPSLFDKLDV